MDHSLESSRHNDDPHMAELRAEYERIEAEFRHRLQEADIDPCRCQLTQGDPRIEKLRATENWRQQALDELHSNIDFVHPPQLPLGWEGAAPIGDDGAYIDVLTIDGLRSWADYCLATFYPVS